jgi:polar amino acid transport system permease protein
MPTYRWNFEPLLAQPEVLLAGALGTLRLFVVCLIAALTLGLVVGLMRLSARAAVRWPATAFVEFFRNTPVLVQILWFYFALPILLPGASVGAMAAAALGISLSSAAFAAEIYRGGIRSIERGQWEAGRALGMSALQLMRRIVLPQALRRVLPALTNRGIEIFKMTTLASAVAYVEMLQQGKLLASLYFNPIETYTVIALAFFIFLLPLVRATYALERRLAKGHA